MFQFGGRFLVILARLVSLQARPERGEAAVFAGYSVLSGNKVRISFTDNLNKTELKVAYSLRYWLCERHKLTFS